MLRSGSPGACSQATMFPLPKPVLKKTSVDPEIPQFKWDDLGNKEEIGRGSFGAVYCTSLGEKELVVKKKCSVLVMKIRKKNFSKRRN